MIAVIGGELSGINTTYKKQIGILKIGKIYREKM